MLSDKTHMRTEKGKKTLLIQIFVAAVEWVWDDELGIETLTQHQLEQGHLVLKPACSYFRL